MHDLLHSAMQDVIIRQIFLLFILSLVDLYLSIYLSISLSHTHTHNHTHTIGRPSPEAMIAMLQQKP